jgi:hypothetical protein
MGYKHATGGILSHAVESHPLLINRLLMDYHHLSKHVVQPVND